MLGSLIGKAPGLRTQETRFDPVTERQTQSLEGSMKKLSWLASLLPIMLSSATYAHDPAETAALEARITALEEIVYAQHPPYDAAIHGERNTTNITINCLQGEWEFFEGAEWWPNGVSFRASDEFHLIADVSYYRFNIVAQRDVWIQAVMNDGRILTLAKSFNDFIIAQGCLSQSQQRGLL